MGLKQNSRLLLKLAATTCQACCVNLAHAAAANGSLVGTVSETNTCGCKLLRFLWATRTLAAPVSCTKNTSHLATCQGKKPTPFQEASGSQRHLRGHPLAVTKTRRTWQLAKARSPHHFKKPQEAKGTCGGTCGGVLVAQQFPTQRRKFRQKGRPPTPYPTHAARCSYMLQCTQRTPHLFMRAIARDRSSTCSSQAQPRALPSPPSLPPRQLCHASPLCALSEVR